MSNWFGEQYYLAAKLRQLHAVGERDADGAAYTEDTLKKAIADSGLTPEQHYMRYGRSEGLNPNAWFNEAEYLRAKLASLQTGNALPADRADWSTTSIDDLRDYMGDVGLTVIAHYETYGWKERNADGTLLNPSNAFDATEYMAAKLHQLQTKGTAAEKAAWTGKDVEDLASVFEQAGVSPVSHYELYGEKESDASGIPFVASVPDVQRVEADANRVQFGEPLASNPEAATLAADTITPTAAHEGQTDTTAPTAVAATAKGQSVTITWSEALDTANLPAASAFSVSVGGKTATVSGIAANGHNVTLTLVKEIAYGDAVTVSYKDLTSGNDAKAIQDVAGNDAVSFSVLNAVNTTVAPTTPVDDVPSITANIDAPTVTSGATVAGDVAITWGADGAATVDSITVNGVTGTAVDGKLSFTLTNGTLTLAQDGGFTFVANANTTADQTLTFKVTDADGDTATSEVMVAIAKPDTPDFTTDITVDEAGLAGGSNAGADAETATWTAPEGYTIEGIVANVTQGTASLVDGALSYTLSGPLTHGTQGADMADNADTVTVTLRDANGNTYDVTVNVDVVDDAPSITSNIDAPTVASGATVEGDVAITWGADGAATADSITVNGVTGTAVDGKLSFTLTNGTLTLAQDGGFTFVANANTNAAQDFTFKVTDGDGDIATSEATVNVIDSTVKPEDMTFTTQDADVLANGTDTASAALAAGVTLTQAAVDAVNATIEYGEFSLADGQLVFTQSAAYGHGASEDSHSFDAVSFNVTDGNGNATTLDVTVTIEDDGPSISVGDDITELASGTTSATGNWTHAFGADVPAAQTVTIGGQILTIADGNSVAVAGTHGTLTVNADGTYSYKANPNATGSDSFNFTITDADGDSKDTTLNVGVVDSAVKPDSMTFTTQDADVAANGTDTFAMTIPTGVTLTQAAVDAVNATIEYGEFSIADGQLVFTQSTAYGHGASEDSHTFGELSFNVTDGNGNATTLDVKVTIEDDGPSISVGDDITGLASGTTSAEGSWTHAFGADLPAAQTVTIGGQTLTIADGNSLAVAGTYGTLTVNADGTYSYKANPNATGSDSFNFTITDADGDSKDTTLNVGVVDSAVKPDSMTFTTQDADVAANGTDTFAMTIPTGVTLTQAAVDAVNATIEYGEFSIADGQLVFTQSTAYGHGASEDSHTFGEVSFNVTDGNGNATTLDVTVTIEDDEPTIGDATNSLAEDATTAITGDVVTDNHTLGDGTFAQHNFAWDADQSGKHGTVTLNEDGTYSYTLNNADAAVQALGEGDSLTETFTYTFTDKDGDSDTGTLTITINGTDGEPTIGDATNSLAEDATAAITGDVVTDNHTLGDGTFAQHNFAWDAGQSGSYGTVTLNADGTYSYTLDNANAAVQALGVGDSLTETFTYSFTDKDGDADTGTLTITINDTNYAPTIEGSSIRVEEAALAVGSKPDRDTEKAADSFTVGDVDGLDNIASVTIAGTPFGIGTGGLADLIGRTVTSNGDTITITGVSGGTVSFAYTLNAAKTGPDGASTTTTADFDVSVADKNASTQTATINVTVEDDVPSISASLDSDTVDAGASVTGTAAITWGADGAAATDSITVNGVTGTAVDGKLSFTLTNGTLTLAQDGGFTFVAKANTTADQTLTFQVTDADGDTATSTVSVTIAKPDTPSFTTDITVKEEGLADGSDTSTTSETALWTAPAGYTIEGIVTNGAHGTASLVDGKLSYTLGDSLAVSGDGKNTADNADAVTVTIKDASSGNAYDVTVNVDVVDDVPSITVNINASEVASGATVEGDVAITWGADGAAAADSITVNGVSGMVDGTSLVFQLSYGTLTLAQNGDYTFVAKANTTANQTLTFKVTDADGDTATTATLTAQEVTLTQGTLGYDGVAYTSQVTNNAGVILAASDSVTIDLAATAAVADSVTVIAAANEHVIVQHFSDGDTATTATGNGAVNLTAQASGTDVTLTQGTLGYSNGAYTSQAQDTNGVTLTACKAVNIDLAATNKIADSVTVDADGKTVTIAGFGNADKAKVDHGAAWINDTIELTGGGLGYVDNVYVSQADGVKLTANAAASIDLTASTASPDAITVNNGATVAIAGFGDADKAKVDKGTAHIESSIGAVQLTGGEVSLSQNVWTGDGSSDSITVLDARQTVAGIGNSDEITLNPSAVETTLKLTSMHDSTAAGTDVVTGVTVGTRVELPDGTWNVYGTNGIYTSELGYSGALGTVQDVITTANTVALVKYNGGSFFYGRVNGDNQDNDNRNNDIVIHFTDAPLDDITSLVKDGSSNVFTLSAPLTASSVYQEDKGTTLLTVSGVATKDVTVTLEGADVAPDVEEGGTSITVNPKNPGPTIIELSHVLGKGVTLDTSAHTGSRLTITGQNGDGYATTVNGAANSLEGKTGSDLLDIVGGANVLVNGKGGKDSSTLDVITLSNATTVTAKLDAYSTYRLDGNATGVCSFYTGDNTTSHDFTLRGAGASLTTGATAATLVAGGPAVVTACNSTTRYIFDASGNGALDFTATGGAHTIINFSNGDTATADGATVDLCTAAQDVDGGGSTPVKQITLTSGTLGYDGYNTTFTAQPDSEAITLTTQIWSSTIDLTATSDKADSITVNGGQTTLKHFGARDTVEIGSSATDDAKAVVNEAIELTGNGSSLTTDESGVWIGGDAADTIEVKAAEAITIIGGKGADHITNNLADSITTLLYTAATVDGVTDTFTRTASWDKTLNVTLYDDDGVTWKVASESVASPATGSVYLQKTEDGYSFIAVTGQGSDINITLDGLADTMGKISLVAVDDNTFTIDIA